VSITITLHNLVLCSTGVTKCPIRSSILQPIWKNIINNLPKSFLISISTQDIVEKFVRAPPIISRSSHFRGDWRVLQLVDDATDCDNDVVDCDTNATSAYSFVDYK